MSGRVNIFTMFNISKHLFISLIFLMIGVGALQACAPTISESTESPVKATEPEIEPTRTITPVPTEELENELSGQVSIWHSFEETEMESFSEVITIFQEMNPEVEFDILYVPSYDILNKYEASTGNGGGACILIGASEWGPTLFDSKQILDITEYANEEFLATINPIALGSVQYSDAIVGLPLNVSGIVPFRNKRILPAAPTTFDELIAFAQESTSGDEVGAYLDYGLFFSGGHLEGIGGQLMNADGDPTFNNDKGIEWIELIQRFEEAGPVELNSDNDINLFIQDKAGMIFAGLWEAPLLAEAIESENLAIDPWPIPLSGYVQTENIYLNSNSTNNDLETCWSFMEFLLSPEAQIIFADPSMAGFIPPILGIPIADPLQVQVMETFNGGATLPVIPEMNVYWDPINKALLSVIEQGADAADALQIAHDTVETELEIIREE
jgi:arabinogalactan oligomer/maltooligosaccharide transport system substrate-binding protein